MIRFKSIKMINFMSYGAIPTIIKLDQPGTILLLGEDLDNTASGVGSNGVGKTSILNAIVYALYDKPLDSDIKTKDDLVNHVNKKGMEVTIDFEKNGINYIIERCRKMKVGATGNYTTLYENGKDITLDSSDNTNEYIENKILNIPYDLFVRMVAFPAQQVPFLKLPVRHPTASNQTDIIEELFDLKTLSQKAEALKKEITNTEGSLKINLEKIETLKGEQERHTKQLESAKKRVITWETSTNLEAEDTTHRIEKLKNINVEEQRAFIDRFTIVATTVRDNMEVISKKQNQFEFLGNKLDRLNHELTHLYKGKCPRCNQLFQESQGNMADIDRELAEGKEQMGILKHELNELATILKDLTAEKTDLSTKLQVRKLEELLEIKNNVDQLNNKWNDLRTKPNPYLEALEELEAIELEVVDMTKINELKSLLDHQTFLLKLLTKKDSFVRKALLNKNIPFLNTRLQKYLKDLDLPHQVEFTHEMTASISKFGYPMSFGNLSNGQKARVNIALSFAFRDVLQSMHDTVNICMLDEVLDVGLDAVGVQAAARMLKRKARDEKLSLYIISHKDEIDNAFDRKLIVQLEGGFSSIRYEDG